MLLRVGGFVIVLFWAASMTWLVWHDVWPVLTAGDPPDVMVGAGPAGSGWQVGIYNKYDQRIGTAWSACQGPLGRTDIIFLKLPPAVDRLRIRIESQFTEQGQLDDFELKVQGLEVPVDIRGERFPSVYGFTVTAGPLKESFKINASDAGLIGDVFRPFTALPGLEVGRSWRMQVVNPVAVVTGLGRRFTPILVRVTRRETITTFDDRSVSCLVVEAPGVKAWVDPDGVVLVQEVELPVGGRITLRDEPFDALAMRNARATFPVN